MQFIAPSPVSHGILSRFWYGSSLADFATADPDTILAQMVRNGEFDLLTTQRDAWLFQINFLQSQLANLTGTLFLEFSIPRMGRRIDAVLLVGGVIFVIEFKVGAREFERAAVDQAWDYALDLKNFHEASHSASIIPILIATESTTSMPLLLQAHEDKIYHPLRVHAGNFRQALDLSLQTAINESIDHQQWSRATYRPTPTIIEAARALYAQHSVEAIARYDAGAQNLRVTSTRIEELVDEARRQKRKLICFVTGVPGAGKTLVGLNVATLRRDINQPTHAVFLSGNGPLVAVLREALTRDEVSRQRNFGNRVRKGKIAESVKAFIQNVHHFVTKHCVTPLLRRNTL